MDATILLVSTVMGNCLYLILKVVLVYFFSRCLQTVLPHIHLLWELALTNEVLIVQMLKKGILIIHCFMCTVDTHVNCYPSFCDNVHKKKVLIILRKPFLHLKLEYMVICAT